MVYIFSPRSACSIVLVRICVKQVSVSLAKKREELIKFYCRYCMIATRSHAFVRCVCAFLHEIFVQVQMTHIYIGVKDVDEASVLPARNATYGTQNVYTK